MSFVTEFIILFLIAIVIHAVDVGWVLQLFADAKTAHPPAILTPDGNGRTFFHHPVAVGSRQCRPGLAVAPRDGNNAVLGCTSTLYFASASVASYSCVGFTPRRRGQQEDQ